MRSVERDDNFRKPVLFFIKPSCAEFTVILYGHFPLTTVEVEFNRSFGELASYSCLFDPETNHLI